MQKRLKTGLVLGKFIPVHMGHKYLIDFARNYVDKVIVVIGIRKTDPIPGKERVKWLKTMFPDVEVIEVEDINPSEDHPDYWKIWEKTLRDNLPYIPQYIFASEDYGWRLSTILGMEYIPVDHKRRNVEISGTKIRKNPFRYWKYIPPVVRPYFIKRVCIFGPESTGKSILAKKLAKHFKTVYAHEYARDLLEHTNGKVKYSHIDKIARGHRSVEEAMALQANKVLFSDTDILTTIIWSKVFFRKYHSWIEKEVGNRKYDLYIVLDVDVPWIDDKLRYLPKKRKWFLDLCISELKKRKRNYVLIGGNWNHRFKQAVKEVKKIL